MRKLVAAFSVVAMVLLTPGIAQAWEVVDETTHFRRATAAGWTREYLRVRFYAGHDRGVSGTFSVAYRVECVRGFEVTWEDATAHDTRARYWDRIVRIPPGQGRCYERILVVARNPRNVRITTGIEVPG